MICGLRYGVHGVLLQYFLGRVDPDDPDSTSGVYGYLSDVLSANADQIVRHDGELVSIVLDDNDAAKLWRFDRDDPSNVDDFYGDQGGLPSAFDNSNSNFLLRLMPVQFGLLINLIICGA